METEKQLSEKESLDLITRMINKAKESCHDTGVSAIMWGIIIAVCALEKLAELEFGYRLPFDIYLLTIVAVIPQVILSVREQKQRRVKTYDDIFLDYLWLGFGISIFLMIFITNGIFNSYETAASVVQEATGKRPAFRFQEYVAPLFLLLYGMPTFITGAAFKFRPMLWGGIFSWVCCIITIYSSIKIDHALTAAAAILAWLIPGIIMERDYRKAKKDLAEANV